MNYFILEQDRNLENVIEIEGFNNSQKVVLLKNDEKKYRDVTIVPIMGKESSIYPDFMQAPTILISDELQNIFKLYENSIIYKIAVFTNQELKKQKVYRLVIPEILDVLDDGTTYLKNGWVDKIVLNKEKIGDYNIFQIKVGVDCYFVVSLDVVESMLKRGIFTGVKFKEVEVR